MAKLKCKTHGRRVQISTYSLEPKLNGSVVRVLHRSDSTRCNGEMLTIGKRVLDRFDITKFAE